MSYDVQPTNEHERVREVQKCEQNMCYNFLGALFAMVCHHHHHDVSKTLPFYETSYSQKIEPWKEPTSVNVKWFGLKTFCVMYS
jgi:hypothetical protein